MRDPAERPSISKTAQGPQAAFGALLAQAEHDPMALRGLAAAYSGLDKSGRSEIVDAIVNDARREEVCASVVLATLLAVEEDLQVAQHIANCIAAAGGTGLAMRVEARAFGAGDETHGAIVLSRPLHGPFMEVLALVWDGGLGITQVLFEPLAREVEQVLSHNWLQQEFHFERMPMAYAIDLLAPVLWAHRRIHGSLPESVQRFADLFSIQAAP